MKTAIVYDRVNKWGGAERLLLTLHEIYPKAELYTSVYSPRNAIWAGNFPKVITSFLNRFKQLRESHEVLSIFMPIAFESFDFDKYDLVISVSSEAAKGIITKPQTKHICVCLTPTRYLYSGFSNYENSPPGKLALVPFYKFLSKPFIKYVKMWDLVASKRPDIMVAISGEVKSRIKKYYKREADVIYPPVDVKKFNYKNYTNKKSNLFKKHNKSLKKNGYYLLISRLEPYKKVDLAIRAFNKLGYKLVIVGVGSLEKKLKLIAGDNIIFKGFVKDSDLPGYYRNAKAFIFPQEEDFGLTAVEAQASGCPVIAFRKGGVLDTVEQNTSGVFFDKQEVDCLVDTVKQFEKMKFNKTLLLKSAERFSKDRFKQQIVDLIRKTV